MIRTIAMVYLAAGVALLSACSATKLAGGLHMDSKSVRFEVVSIWIPPYHESSIYGGTHYYVIKDTNKYQFVFVLLKITNVSGEPVDGINLRSLRLEADNWSQKPEFFLVGYETGYRWEDPLLDRLKPGDSDARKVVFVFPKSVRPARLRIGDFGTIAIPIMNKESRLQPSRADESALAKTSPGLRIKPRETVRTAAPAREVAAAPTTPDA